LKNREQGNRESKQWGGLILLKYNGYVSEIPRQTLLNYQYKLKKNEAQEGKTGPFQEEVSVRGRRA
jgi:hypothetical protein